MKTTKWAVLIDPYTIIVNNTILTSVNCAKGRRLRLLVSIKMKIGYLMLKGEQYALNVEINKEILELFLDPNQKIVRFVRVKKDGTLLDVYVNTDQIISLTVPETRL